jgi:pyridoxamine 5'-phosphate oxidase family protein
MSVFTQAEIEYLQSQTLGRLATVGKDGTPHVTPVTFHFNADEDAVDIGGIGFGDTKKWRDVNGHPKAAFLVDDVLRDPRRARAVEIRGRAEPHATGGDTINPRFPNFVPEFIRLRPTRIVSWGLEEDATGNSFRHDARSVDDVH